MMEYVLFLLGVPSANPEHSFGGDVGLLERPQSSQWSPFAKDPKKTL